MLGRSILGLTALFVALGAPLKASAGCDAVFAGWSHSLKETEEYAQVANLPDPETQGRLLTVKIKNPPALFRSSRGQTIRGLWLFTGLFGKTMGRYGFFVDAASGTLTYPDLVSANQRLELAEGTPLATQQRHWSPWWRTFVSPGKFVFKLAQHRTVLVQSEPGAHFHDSLEHNYLFVPDSIWSWVGQRMDAIHRLRSLLGRGDSGLEGQLSSQLESMKNSIGLTFDLSSDAMIESLLPLEGAEVDSPAYREQVFNVFSKFVVRSDFDPIGLGQNSAQDLALAIASRLGDKPKVRRRVLELAPLLGSTEVSEESLRGDVDKFVSKIGVPDWQTYADVKSYLDAAKR